MLQDLKTGRLENEFYNLQPAYGDRVVCISGNNVLLNGEGTDLDQLPAFEDVSRWAEDQTWTSWGEGSFRYIFRMEGVNFYLWMGNAGVCVDEAYRYEQVRQFRQPQSKELVYALLTAWHLYCWYRNNRFCGSCAAPTVHDEKERMLRCPVCGNMIFPKISPAIIVAVTDGDRILLSKYAGRTYTRYALLAGYTEIGETLEQTVHREVMEEVGLRVKNIRYYKSQPWGVDGNILMGFFCDLDGDDTIVMDATELSFAQWFDRGEVPAKDDGFSLTREMIRVFTEGREPR